jgi:MinD-like ATPase involved in chromosome partitioning or flagellar assembly
VEPFHVALVSRDDSVRAQMAAAFDAAPASWKVTLHREPVSADAVVYGPDLGSVSGIVFDPAHPEAAYEHIRAMSSTEAPVIAVTSTRGGTGATSVALHLAASAARSRRVCLIDLDITWGIEWRLGFDEMRRWQPGEDVKEATVPVAGGFRVVAPAVRTREALDALIELAARAFEVVIADAPAGVALDAVLARSSVGVLVVQATVPGAKRAAAFCARQKEIRWAIVANRLGGGGETTLDGLRRTSRRRIALELPCTPSLRDAEDKGRLLLRRWSRWSRRIDSLARALQIA